MELYTFTGATNADGRGVLRVKADHPVELLPGFHRILEEMPDSDTVQSFTLVDKVGEETSGGYHYAWYRVKDYSCTVDKTAVVARKAESTALTNSITFVALTENGTIDPVTAGEHTELFAAWEPGVSYTVGNVRRYGDKLFQCIQAHVSQADWTPDKTASLWKNIADPAEEWPEWSQPIGAQDAYSTGDKVSYSGKHWVSNCDNNVWTPGVYGWDEVA